MKTNGQKLSYYLGTIFIVISLIGFAFIFAPLALTYITPQMISSQDTSFSISIPRIKAQAAIIQNVDPWTEIEYKAALERGVAHARGTSLPGGSGTVFLFAHSSGMPWELTQNNTIFLRLGELTKGDTIHLKRNGNEYKYRVSDKKVVSPTDVHYLLDAQKNQLILQTCTPIGTAINRLLVFAEPTN